MRATNDTIVHIPDGLKEGFGITVALHGLGDNYPDNFQVMKYSFLKNSFICIVGNSEPLVGMIWPMRPGNLLVCTLWALNASPPRAFVGTRGMEVNVAYPERTTIHS